MKVKILYNVLLLTWGIVVAIIINYYNLRTAQVNEFFSYSWINVKDEYNIWDDIYFVSSLTRYKEIDMKYIDILRCDSWEWYTWFSQSVWYSKNMPVWVFNSVWRYEGDLPIFPSICYLESSPTAQLDFGIEKTQKITTKQFTIWK